MTSRGRRLVKRVFGIAGVLRCRRGAATRDQCRLTAGLAETPWLSFPVGTTVTGIDSEMTDPPPGWFDSATFPPWAVTTAEMWRCRTNPEEDPSSHCRCP